MAGRRHRLRERALRLPLGLSSPLAAGVIAIQLAAATAVTYLLGGAGPVPPHIFYFPVLFSGIRYGATGAALTGVIAGLAAGPLMPLDVAAGTPQLWTDWVSRTGFFAGIGAVTAFAFQQTILGLRQEADALRAEHEFLHAVSSGQLRVHYQPIVSLESGRIVGAEALVRWQHPTRGLLGPGEFLPLARHRDLLGYVRQTVLSEACRQAAHWCRSIASVEERFRISVNIDAQDLLDARLIDDVAQALAANRLDPARLCLEITETGLIDDLETSIESLLALRLLGVSLAIDDFGTGYASLEYAHRLPVDEIKIDRAFIHQVGANPAVKSIVRSVIDLADRLGKQTVAEGVESADDLAELVGLGCHRAQGFYFSKPLPAADLQELLRRAPVWPNRSVFAQ